MDLIAPDVDHADLQQDTSLLTMFGIAWGLDLPHPDRTR